VAYPTMLDQACRPVIEHSILVKKSLLLDLSFLTHRSKKRAFVKANALLL
jgi:hypothetical protein